MSELKGCPACGWISGHKPHCPTLPGRTPSPHKIHTWQRWDSFGDYGWKCLICGAATDEEPTVWVEDMPKPAASGWVLTPESAFAEARRRYWYDAEFHARVDRGVIAAGRVGYDLDDESGPMLTHAIALVLQIEDETAPASTPSPDRDEA